MSAKTESGQESIATIVEQLVERVADLEDRVDDLEQDKADLEQELKQERETRAKESAEDRRRLHEVEETVENVEETVEDGGTPTSDPTPETGLEQLSRLPDELLEDESANVRRAVSLAEMWRDHASKAPVGFVLSSGELARVLRDETDCRGHSQTAARVIDRLDQLGGDGVTVVERRGERRVAFDADLVGRLEDLGESPTAARHDVVTGASV
jgi:hypothetical protein